MMYPIVMMAVKHFTHLANSSMRVVLLVLLTLERVGPSNHGKIQFATLFYHFWPASLPPFARSGDGQEGPGGRFFGKHRVNLSGCVDKRFSWTLLLENGAHLCGRHRSIG